MMENGYSLADIAAATGNGNNNGWGGDSGAWWVIILLLALGRGFGFGGNGGGSTPYVINDSGCGCQRGFDQAAVMAGINGITASVSGGFADIQQTLCNGFANAETAANARQIADMQQAFAAQTAMAQGFNTLGSQFAQCCCDNRLATADLKYTIATENCADRYEAAQNTRDIIENANRNNQSILDKLCQLELDAKNDKISDLERQLTMANLAASQTAQTAQIRAGQVAEVDALYNRLSQCPVPTMPVYGMQPIFSCPQNQSCGCNGGF